MMSNTTAVHSWNSNNPRSNHCGSKKATTNAETLALSDRKDRIAKIAVFSPNSDYSLDSQISQTIKGCTQV